MKLFNSVGPNPRVVRMFAAEKGIDLPRQEVDIRGGENRQEGYLKVNPAGQCPALQLDDGSVLTEITAICEYLEEMRPEPALIGKTPEQRAETRMWTRRIDLGIVEPLTAGFRAAEGLKMFQNRMRCIPHAADDLKACAQDRLAWLDGQMAGRTFVAGDRFTLADILLFCFVDFGRQVKQPLDPGHGNLAAWFERVAARPSTAA